MVVPKNKDKYGQPVEDFVELYHKGTSTKELLNHGKEIGVLDNKELKTPSLKYFSPPDRNQLKEKK